VFHLFNYKREEEIVRLLISILHFCIFLASKSTFLNNRMRDTLEELILKIIILKIIIIKYTNTKNNNKIY
jgi:hypothetical protein